MVGWDYWKGDVKYAAYLSRAAALGLHGVELLNQASHRVAGADGVYAGVYRRHDLQSAVL